MTTKAEDSTAEQSPDHEGDLHLGESTPDPQRPINTGHGTDSSFAECEDVPGSEAV
jgi:hypothetical protein